MFATGKNMMRHEKRSRFLQKHITTITKPAARNDKEYSKRNSAGSKIGQF